MARFRRRKITDSRKNGEMKTASLGMNTPPPERKSKFSALGRLFKPWKWKRKKKSEKIEKTAVDLERKISMRTSREELIRKGVLKEPEEIPETNHLPKIEAVEEETIEAAEAENNKHIDGAAAIAMVTSNGGPEAREIPKINENDVKVSIKAPDNSLPVSSSSLTTQAEITVTSINTTVSSAHVRPVIFHPVVPPSAEPPPPAPLVELSSPSSVTVSPNIPQPEQTTVRWGHVETVAETTLPANDGYNDGTGDYDDPMAYIIADPNSPYDAIPASEPDLRSLPKKSALKKKYPDGVMASLTSSLTRPIDTSTLNPSHVSFSGRASPQPTATFLIPQNKVQLNHNEDNKENIPERTPSPAPPDTFNPPDYDNLQSDSDSEDGEIHYKDDDDNEESSLASKVARQDSLARFLSNRPTQKDLIEKNIIPNQSDREKQESKEAIGTKLTRRLSLRPTQEELEQKNILHTQSTEERIMTKEEKKRFLIRKLSFRPSVEELKEKKIIKFNDYIEMTDAHEYDRRADKPWTRLTPKDKAVIRKELNEFKSKEMDVHDDSRHLTRFHRP
ncbi:phosphatase and actin regulator 1 isoform X3 [Patella vulgata]|uniref:phosphatase and actin regulator 1 isoform X3 n=1 Tax=Patella vulgata TaxID=6465 RepID=UPI0021805E93|nr:phosphatase and actin regulator 1 isoform X3 [Patella vulgata]